MKYKVGDKVVIKNRLHGHGFEIGSIVMIRDCSDNDYCVMDESLKKWWVNEDEIQLLSTNTNYRALYEQEKAIRMAAEKMLCDQADMTIDEWMQAFDNYQQLKQQYNAKD